ncbi:hypothetical protein FNV43_RR05521 [Rhamnella rubrinervis]|uniref:Uncharacterized protein n=1 Tax=Rhamnella rubrinervis TaxID=2594499 RepID=A0A8K0HN43_9ROSA|nr:hypothetical protein FNV43_RR05521 [Rhamnella rubrinervis]
MSHSEGSTLGGWTTFPFITGTLAGLTLAVAGWATNLVVYLIEKFHVKSIAATQFVNILSGCTSLLPVVGAIVADSFGCYSVIYLSSFISLVGIILMALTSILNPLRPQPCEIMNGSCPIPSKIQFAVLYCGVALGAIGLGGTRFTIAALGANQFDRVKDQESFFNWYVVILYASAVTGATAIVYIEDNVSWGLGFGLCVVANVASLCIFFSGSRLYRRDKKQGSPFLSLARVIVAAFRKRKLGISSKAEDYYHGQDMTKEILVASTPTKTFGFLNQAALITEGDITSDGSIAKPWKLCTQQEVEDLKTLIRIFPIISSGIFLSTPVAVQSSLTVLQALTVDRHIGQHFKIPAGSMIIFVLTSAAISVTLVDKLVCPIWQKITHHSPTPLQRIGVGHVFNALGMAIAAIVESKRLEIVRNHHLINHPGSTVPMLVLWLVPQLVVVGFGEAFHYPGQVTFYYQEFPKSLRSTATAMISVIMGIAYYMSTGIIELVQRVTGWLPDDINNGRVDNVYWMLVVVAVINFVYYAICARFYKYQSM